MQEGSLLRFRCHTGHSFTAESLEAGLTDEIEDAIWFALRALGEKSMLLRQLVEKAREKKHNLTMTLFEEKARAVDQAAGILKKMLTEKKKQSSKAVSASATKSRKRKPAAARLRR